MTKLFATWTGKLIAAAIAVLLLVGLYYGVKRYFTAGLETQVNVSKAQTGAAIESGHEAVETVGNRQAADERGAAIVRETQHEIDKATDPGGVTDAGLNGLHRVRREQPAANRPRR